ncbi:MAG: endonuclease/exonuclease/phosphatase family protein [Lachnospiraceae bacterium]|jgi:hypothetical protein|nr:endonuclease/exonuclease/phosphatase family protein [Lachnospiraceae bacterium]
MRIMFWNTHRNKTINEYIVSLVMDYDIDIFIMAEYNADEIELDRLLKKYYLKHSACFTGGCNGMSIWSNYENMKSGPHDTHYSIQVVNDKYILCCVHLISDAYGDMSDERHKNMREIVYEIQQFEKEVISKNTIIIGDFNEAPYDKGCLSADGFHGLPALTIKDRPNRKVGSTEYRKFYNPMWNFMGDFSYPPGTYYLNRSKLYLPMWYIVDQVVLSQDILPLFKKESLKIITSCSYSDLRDKNDHPDKKISDHFPIVCEIKDK